MYAPTRRIVLLSLLSRISRFFNFGAELGIADSIGVKPAGVATVIVVDDVVARLEPTVVERVVGI